MAVTARGLIGTGSATTAGTTITVTNTTGAVIPAGTFIHITGCWDNINSVTAPTITCSTVGGATATANNATAIGSGVTTTAGSGVWHQCFRVLTTGTIASGATIATLTSNQSAVKRAAHAEGFDNCTTTLRGTVTTGTSTSGSPSVTTTGTALVIGDLVIGSASAENNAQMTADADTAGGAWPPIVGTFTTGGAAGTNVVSSSQYKILTATGTQTFNPTGGGADTVACVYSLVPVLESTFTQAAYRLYADGTETGSTALAAQDTAYEADVSGGDVNVQLRVRLQSTNAGTTAAATDDYQLQYAKNGGAWADVGIAGPALVDSNNVLVGTNAYTLNNGVTIRAAQSFTGDGRPVSTVRFHLFSNGAPTGNVTAAIYAHSGTFGTGGVPTGSELATSTAVLAESLSTTRTWTDFTFPTPLTLTAGTNYCVAFLFSGGSSGNSVRASFNSAGTASHPGNISLWISSWAASTSDALFEVLPHSLSTTAVAYASANLTDGAVTTNRLGAGTGSFSAGEVSEDGLVDDLSWTANNYTELLYSLTLKSADLTEGDTLTFRVVRNGATTGFTYTAVPTIDIGGGAPTVTGTALITQAVTVDVAGTVVAEVVTGTALVSAAVDTTTAGIRETFGTALIEITGNTSATAGGVIVPGTALIDVPVSIDVAGTVVAEIVTGTALLTQSVDVTAAGTRFAIVTGTAALTQSVDVTVAGTVIAEIVTGTALISSSAVITADGTVVAEVVTGTAVLTQAATITAAGTVIAEVVTGTALLTESVAVTAAGTVIAEIVTGTAALTESVAVTVAGTVTVPGGGVALIDVPVAITAEGTVVAEIVTGTAQIATSVAVTAAGARAGTGTALLSSSVAVTAIGTRAGAVAGTALISAAVTVTAAGTVVAEVVSGTALIASSVVVTVTVLKVYERAPYTATWSLLYMGTVDLDARVTYNLSFADGWDTNGRATIDHDYAHSWELV